MDEDGSIAWFLVEGGRGHTFLVYLEEPGRVASPTRINLEEPGRVASSTRINLDKSISSGYPAHLGLTWRNQFLLVTQPT